MKLRLGVAVLSILAVVVGYILVAALPGQARTEPSLPVAPQYQDPAAPDVFASPVNGGCYIAAPGDCRIHIDPYTVNVAPGTRLTAIQVQANGVTVYDFKTDVSNPPPSVGTQYTLSTVAQDFAAVCGQTYTVNVLGRDSGDMNFLNMGQTAQFTCPATVP